VTASYTQQETRLCTNSKLYHNITLVIGTVAMQQFLATHCSNFWRHTKNIKNICSFLVIKFDSTGQFQTLMHHRTSCAPMLNGTKRRLFL